MKALDQRARTIIKVSSEIVKQQEGFFRGGVAYLKPLRCGRWRRWWSCTNPP
jgi:RNA polymerase sigma-54 factor